MAVPSLVRGRRYVSAPAGSYPAPRRPVRGGGAAAQARDAPAPYPADPFHSDEEAFIASQAAPEVSPVAEPAADEQLFAPPASRQPPSIREDEAPRARPSSAPADSSRGLRPLVILVSGVVGVLIGALAGLALLAFMEPSRWLERLLDPLGLWNSADDPLIRASAIMIVVGCGLIGALLPLRLRN